MRPDSITYRFLVGTLLINLIWYVAYLLMGDGALVSPLVVYRHLPALLAGKMGPHLLASLYRILLGIPIALLLGLIIAWLIYSYRPFGRAMNALTYLAYPIPKLALLPIVMLIAGLGDGGKVAMIVLILIFQVIVNVRDSLTNIPRESFHIARSLGADRWRILRYILLPAALPDILSTLRVAIGTAISVLFVTETYGTDRGMGYFITDAWMRFDYIDMYGGIVVLSITGFILFILTDIAEEHFCRWRSAGH